MDLVTRKKQTEEKMKKAFRLKLSDLCKTRAENSFPEMFNSMESWLVMTKSMILHGHHVQAQIHNPIQTNKNTKNGEPSENDFHGETV